MILLLLNAVLILAVVAAIHVYLYRRLVRDVSRKDGVWRRTGTVLVWLFAAVTVGAMVAGPADAPFRLVRALEGPGLYWLALLPYLIVALLLGELVRPLLRRALARRAGDTPVPGASQRNGPANETVDETRIENEEAESGSSSGDKERNSETSRRIFVARTAAIGAITLGGSMAYLESMVGDSPSQSSGDRGIEVSLPFTGLWRVENSPARRVPSHGTDMYGGRYAIDFVGVDDRHRTAGSRSWRTFLATEPPELFFAFGRPILSPVHGTVVAVHDGEPDHEARRSQAALIPYALSQGARVRQGVGAIAGNHVVISLAEGRVFVALVHFQAGSIRVSAGDEVVVGQHIASCGNSGNSTQPHVHMQAMDSDDLSGARGVPMRFRHFREWPSGLARNHVRDLAVPGERAVVEPL
ncbi:M23 family metallopeptidase [Nocardiopsis synnemataformans]|uniref:M23 family metallopeptidase n=1 Tax=Nocardiopsis synnemataformans TaxID=61305 RepID=UPI003EB9FE07